jgi:hypothetical protein
MNLDRQDRSIWYIHIYTHQCINSRRQVAVAIKFCSWAPNISGSSIWNPLHVTFLVPRILKGVRFFLKIFFAPVYRKALTLNKHVPTEFDNHFHFTLRTKSEGQNINIIHSKESFCPALFSNFKTNNAEVLSGVRTVCLRRFTDSLPACYAAGMNTNVKLKVTLQGVRTWIMLLQYGTLLICLYGRMGNTDDSVPFLQKYAHITQVINHSWDHLIAPADV